MPPGPTSTRTRFGSPSNTSTSSENRTVERTWRAQVAGLVASLGASQVPVTLDSNGICGSRSVWRDRKPVNSGIIESIRREWNACDVRTRRATMPFSVSRSLNWRMLSSDPATTQPPGSLIAAMSTSPSGIQPEPRGSAPPRP